jgi:hypothetical protein
MPRVKRMGVKDPREDAVREEIGAIMGKMQLSQAKLAKMTGIKPTTLQKRIGKGGDVGSMRLSELWKIQDVAK